jgi:YfiH family protein
MTLANELFFTADNIHCAEAAAVFSTRHGDGAENHKAIAESLGFCAENICGVNQVHSDGIVLADVPAEKNRADADAMITNKKGILISVRTADCVPILLYDAKNHAVAAIHAGWRGTFLQIAQKTICRMTQEFGTHPQNLRAAIGSAIGICCYNVDENFHSQFKNEFGEKIEKFFSLFSEKIFCDLISMNKFFLTEAGILEKNILASNLCTKCNPHLFFSHRLSGKNRGTMTAFTGVKAF